MALEEFSPRHCVATDSRRVSELEPVTPEHDPIQLFTANQGGDFKQEQEIKSNEPTEVTLGQTFSKMTDVV
jgi:hypothetical protein